MRRLDIGLVSLVLGLALAACGGAAAPASPGISAPVAVRSPTTQPAAVASAPASGPGAASVSASPSAQPSASRSSWTRPLDVKPIVGASIFKVVSQTPSPGDKVPIFFMGAQF